MKSRIMVSLIFLVTLLALSGGAFGSADISKSIKLVGWGIDEKDPNKFIVDARNVGFDELITWSTDSAFLKKAVGIGKNNNIKISSCITPMEGLASLWAKHYPVCPVPWQIMTEDEEAACKFIMAGRNQYIIPYQFGGEPKMKNEVLCHRIICFNSLEARELFKPLIDDIVSVPGIEGIAFDGFGYQNYRRCYCDHCQQLFTEYCGKHQEMSKDDAEVVFFRDVVVDYVNYLADYARSKKKDIKTSIHIWPVFTPEPLYGNRLDVDFCGQTAAWYTLWPQGKIAEYSKIISREAQKYYPRQHGVGMIGYYDRPGEFPVKDVIRVDIELSTMIENGCRIIQVCGVSDVINNKAVSAVFKKYFE